MLISRNWLQRHIKEPLPSGQDIAQSLLLHSFEIEEVIEKENDTIIDIDVLPNRAHDCLGHQGIAREYTALTRTTLNSNIQGIFHVDKEEQPLSVVIENTHQCLRYSTRTIRNLTITESPKWLKELLLSIGQKPINSLVDATNFILFDYGQPVHAFDADKIVGGITVRNARNNETIILLGGEEIILDSHDLIIADDEGPLALAGIKGGIKAEVTSKTKNVVIEVANFDPLSIRTTARKLKLFTDASKRFENGMSSEYVPQAMNALSLLLSDLHKIERLGAVSDTYLSPESTRILSVSLFTLQTMLGLEITASDVEDIFDRLAFSYHNDKNTYTVQIPFYRLDVLSSQDIVEEVGRIYGYHKIPTRTLDDYVFSPSLYQLNYLKNIIKNIAVANGFYEIKTYTFVNKGDIELYNPPASDKKALRKNLLTNMQEALEKNMYSIDLLGLDILKIFEIGRVYTKDGEHTECIFGIQNKNKQAQKKYGFEKEQLENIITIIQSELGVLVNAVIDDTTARFSLDILKTDVTEYGDVLRDQSYVNDTVFHPISAYPYSVRDVSFWSNDTSLTIDDYRSLIIKSNAQFLKKIFLFDQFEKEGRVSYAFSLIFQSDKKTLLESDIDADMDAVREALKKTQAEIR